jgi:hypothetical protein
MGHEILYCAICSGRILGADLEKGKALRAGHRVACPRCRPVLLGSLTPEELASLEEKPTPKALPRGVKPSTVRIPTLHVPRRNPSPLPWILAGVAVLVVVLVAVAAGGRKPAVQAEPAPPRLVESRPKPPPPPPVEDSSKGDAARKLVEAARALAPSAGLDDVVDAWDAALRASDRTPLYAEAAAQYASALERLRAARRASLEEAEKAAQVALEKYDPAGAKAAVEKVRMKHRGAEWASKVDALAKRIDAAAVDARPWIALFDGKSNDFIREEARGSFPFKEGAIVQVSRDSAGQTRREFSEGEFRIRFEAAEPENLYFGFAQGVAGTYYVRWEGERLKMLNGAPQELWVGIRGGVARATLEGREVPVIVDGKPGRGPVQFNGRACRFRILSLEFRE